MVADDARAEAERNLAEIARDTDLTFEWGAGYKAGFREGAEWVAGRAETTTATTEDAETAIWHDLLDTWGTSASGRRTMSPATARGITRHVINALNERGLFVTHLMED